MIQRFTEDDNNAWEMERIMVGSIFIPDHMIAVRGISSNQYRDRKLKDIHLMDPSSIDPHTLYTSKAKLYVHGIISMMMKVPWPRACHRVDQSIFQRRRRFLASSTVSSSNHSNTNNTEQSPNPLIRSWPQLVAKFEETSNAQGRFPLFPERVMKQVTMKDDRQAAVLVLLCSVGGQPSVLLTKRSSRLSQHAAEISFPGGHYEDDQDSSLIDTALREAMEELLDDDPSADDPSSQNDDEHHNKKLLFSQHSPVLQIVGQAVSLPALRGTPVTPVIAGWMEDFSSADHVAQYFPGDPREVAQVFTVPLQRLVEVETTRRLPQNRFGVTQGPVFPTEQGNVWGLTAYILRPLLHTLLGPVFGLQKKNKNTQRQ